MIPYVTKRFKRELYLTFYKNNYSIISRKIEDIEIFLKNKLELKV